MSKRKNPTSITYYRDMGYLPEALLNYLSLMGWSMPNEEEIFSREEMVEVFDIDRITTAGADFRPSQVGWLNAYWPAALDTSEYAERIQDWMLNAAKLEQFILMVQDRAERLSDLPLLVSYLLGNLPELSEEHFEHKSLERGDVVRVLYHTVAAFDEMRLAARRFICTVSGNGQGVGSQVSRLLYSHCLSRRAVGKRASLPLFDSWMFLGADLSRARLRAALQPLSPSKKERASDWTKNTKRIKAAIDSAPNMRRHGHRSRIA